MKKIILSLAAVACFVITLSAQVAEHGIGLRFGNGNGMGTEITYQHGLSSINRLEFDLGFTSTHEYYLSNRYGYSRLGLTGLYQWVSRIDDGLNWYIGPGAKLGTWSYSQAVYDYRYNKGLFLAAAGTIGIEYNFPFKLQLSLDARPEIGLINCGTGIDVGFSARYLF